MKHKHSWIAVLDRPIQEYANYDTEPGLRLRVIDKPKTGDAVFIRLNSASVDANDNPCKMMRVYKLDPNRKAKAPRFFLTDQPPNKNLVWEFRDFGWFLYEVIKQTTVDLQRLIKLATTHQDYQIIFDLFDEKIFELSSRPANADAIYEKAMKCVTLALQSPIAGERVKAFRAACRLLNQILIGGTP